MTPERTSLRKKLIELFPRHHGQLLPALSYIHHELGYLPGWAMEVAGWHLGIPSSEVYGAATSYTEFRIDKPPKHVVKICGGLSCLLNGGGELKKKLLEATAPYNSSSPTTQEVSVESSPCAFMCGVPPALEIDGVWHGRVAAESLSELLRKVFAP